MKDMVWLQLVKKEHWQERGMLGQLGYIFDRLYFECLLDTSPTQLL